MEELLERSQQQFISKQRRRIPYRSKSLTELLCPSRPRSDPPTTTQFDLSTLDFDEPDELPIQRSRSAPIFSAKIFDQELAPFLHGEQEFTDHFVYNIDLSSSLRHDDDDDSSADSVTDEPFVGLLQSPLLKTCLTIAEENEEELDELNSTEMPERLATIYESPSPPPVLDEMSRTTSSNESVSSLPVLSDSNIPSSNVDERTTKSNHIRIMRMIPSSTSSLSDFLGTPTILYPIAFEPNNYRQILVEMSLIKKKLISIEQRLNETMREVSEMSRSNWARWSNVLLLDLLERRKIIRTFLLCSFCF